MVAEVNLEREFKFDVDPAFDPPDLRHLVGRTERLPAQHLTTTYLDTADKRLWARGITLRHRLEAQGDSPVTGPGKWTLKLPLPEAADDVERMARSELSWKEPLERVPDEAAAIVAGLVRRAGLEPVVVLSAERRRLLIHGEGGAWAELDDDVVTVSAGARRGLRFRQLELELLDGTGVDAAGRVGPVLELLRRAGARPGGGSKFALAAGLEESRGASSRFPADVGALARRLLGDGLAALLEADYRLRVSGGRAGDRLDLDAGDLRRLAQAAQELSADIRLLGAVLDPVWAQHVGRDLRWLAGLLARLTDEDRLVELVRAQAGGPRAAAGDGEVVEELVGLVRRDRHLGAAELCEALDSDRYFDALDRLEAGARRPPLHAFAGTPVGQVSVEQVLRAAVTAGWRLLRTEVEQLELGSRPGDPDDEAMEHLRVHAARLRHAARVAEPCLGKRARRTAEAAAGLERVLVALGRADRAARALAELAAHPSMSAPVAFLAGRVAGRGEAEAERLRGTWRRPARKLFGPGRPDWSG